MTSNSKQDSAKTQETMALHQRGRLLYGLIGYPIGHSQSPALFRAYAPQREYADYELYPIESLDALPQILRAYRPMGLNVTSPYKATVLSLFEGIVLSPEVERIGAANVLAFDYDSWDKHNTKLPPCKAYNTDACGFRESLKPLLSSERQHALILGTGGAARAVAVALESLAMCASYTFVSREPKRAVEILRPFMQGKPCPIVHYDDLPELIAGHELIINATPLGLSQELAPPIPYELLQPSHLCYDLVYKNEATPFLQRAALQGARCKNGAEMLRLQAEAAWAIWLAQPAP